MTIALAVLKWLFGAIIEFALKPSNWIIAGIIVFFAFSTGYWKGDRHRDRVWKAIIVAEKLHQEVVISEANAKAVAEVARLNEELEKANAFNVELMAQADMDANAARPALGIDSVRRFNRGRPGKSK